MYVLVVRFDIPAENRQTFIDAALEDGRDSGANEPGTLRFELIEDEAVANRFYLSEAYVDEAAFDLHATGPYFAKFFEIIQPFMDGPHFLVRGSRIEDRIVAQ
jgi:autoinducer 2-degrading protein